MLLPKTAKRTLEHRRSKRTVEVGLIIDTLARHLAGRTRKKSLPIDILEFGSGNGFQIEYLKSLGNVTASDIYLSEEIAHRHDVNFVKCSVAQSPFRDAQFDVVFSNHVIEHIEALAPAFRELRRIGSDSCLYAFSVPTNLWLLLTLPAQYLAKLHILTRAVPWRTGVPGGGDENSPQQQPNARPATSGRWRRRLLPTGHGVQVDFGKCYEAFKIESWARLFGDHGFEITETRPLLLYGPSEWPLIPTMRNRGNLCSSVLFLMRKH